MLLLFAPALILFLIFETVSYLRGQRWGWRASMMMASLAWGSIVVVLTELLNLNQKLDPSSLALAWGFVLIALLGLLAALVYKAKARPGLPNLAQAREAIQAWLKEQDAGIWAMLAVLGVQAILLGVVALAYAPNTFESMTYHLPRVMYWLQTHSLAHFAASNVRDIYFPPFAEFVFLHQFALAGGDRYLNLIQWSAFLLALMGVSAVAGELGAPRGTQIAAALLAAGIPMGVLQATTARNDLVEAVWLVSLVWFGLRWGRQPDSWLWAAGTGLSLGLALLTKATGFIYALPLGLLIGTLVLKDGGLRLGLVRGGVVLILALALNLGHLGRNWALYGNPVGAQERVGSEVMSPAVFASNTLRNVAMHVPAECEPPLTFLNTPGTWALTGLRSLHRMTGLGPTDPQTTWGFVNIFDRSLGCVYDEHFAGNALHALLIFGVCLTLPFLRSVDLLAKWIAAALVGGFVLLNLTLRWQLWGSHLQLPLFILWTPLMALTLGLVRRPDLSRIAALLAVVLSFLWIYNNEMRPLSGLISGSIPSRDEQYFQSMPESYSDYDGMADLVAQTGCKRVGLHLSSLVLEYPLWVLLREKGFDGVIHQVDVANETHVYADLGFVPCAIISEGASDDYAASMQEYPFGSFYVYVNEGDLTPAGDD